MFFIKLDAWKYSDVLHTFYRMNCLMINSLTNLLKTLEADLQKIGMPSLEPEFVLVGSAKEGTRIGLANEMDVLVNFKRLNFEEAAPLRVKSAYSLEKTRHCPNHVIDPFLEKSEFNY